MQLLIAVLAFVAGIISTLAVLLVWAWYLGMKERVAAAEEAQKSMEDAIKQYEESQKAVQESLQQTLAEMVQRRAKPPLAKPTPEVTDPNTSTSVKDRLKKAVEITSRQAKIDVRKGPDHILEHNELELEKLSVLKAILADGHDPLITIRYNTGEQEMLLSAYVQSITKGLA